VARSNQSGRAPLSADACLHYTGALRQDGSVPERPPASRIDALLSTAMIAHEVIFEMRRELITAGRGNSEQARLLQESARIVTIELPNLSGTTRRLSAEWGDQCLLHPEGAKRTLEKLEAEVARIEPACKSLLDRQREIAAHLRSMLEQ
jgi:hypothetical protein